MNSLHTWVKRQRGNNTVGLFLIASSSPTWSCHVSTKLLFPMWLTQKQGSKSAQHKQCFPVSGLCAGPPLMLLVYPAVAQLYEHTCQQSSLVISALQSHISLASVFMFVLSERYFIYLWINSSKRPFKFRLVYESPECHLITDKLFTLQEWDQWETPILIVLDAAVTQKQNRISAVLCSCFSLNCSIGWSED